MKSAPRGTSTSSVEVLDITAQGLWLLLDDAQHFLAFQHFPFFRDAPVRAVRQVERPQAHHLYWPQLDVDLHVESIHHPEKYPLVSQSRV